MLFVFSAEEGGLTSFSQAARHAQKQQQQQTLLRGLNYGGAAAAASTANAVQTHAKIETEASELLSMLLQVCVRTSSSNFSFRR